jgi:hypothetical protein
VSRSARESLSSESCGFKASRGNDDGDSVDASVWPGRDTDRRRGVVGREARLDL